MINNRYSLLDWLRGFAILLMVIYHFCYDLYYFNYIDTMFGKGYWIPFRYVIVILFLSLVGVSLVLSHNPKLRWRNLIRRSGQLGLAAFFVSVSSYFIAADKVTVFGIIHFILLATFLSLPFISRPKIALVLGVIVFFLGHYVQSQFFDPLYFHWLGMVETKRPALDYVPVFPWFGIVLIGIFFGHLIQNNNVVQKVFKTNLAEQFHLPMLTIFNSLIERAGQHSLIIYLVHQPILFGLFMAVELLIN
ncbi:heparan-alpha-glucosaminide N-acetyltransferase [Psychrosphaera sp. 1_MG-2023]|uniref:heparan-alpha-glucosaminide N-acetyltransferase n=1 Tax=Psychrosphaera sp. 1_MG-2023 TaxID=3062643 RepID=UPI0026E2994D|nr:heparan-alpha-glucosaminide N-acetyltransferase [Psychrosphaera sp. 1_MG-2023]MDO6717939.1 heparan-alpha-glucosaminide N-acetyltransferase [Psychrosphaera sp. 1_MG-2023]